MIKFDKSYIQFCLTVYRDTPLFLKILKDRKYTVSSTQLSYRQINSLEAEGVIDNTRGNNNKWRRFNLKELIYLKMIEECRKYGVKNDQILKIKRDMFHVEKKSNLTYGDLSLIGALVGVRVGVCLFEDGNFVFTDMENFIKLNGDEKLGVKSYLYLNLNELVNNVLKKTGQTSIIKHAARYPSLKMIIEKNMSSNLTQTEVKILDIFKKDDYTKITIRKGKGDVKVYGEVVKDAAHLTEEELIKILNKKLFSNIKIHKRDGKIVNYSIEDVFKV